MESNRPTGRKRKVIGQGSDIHKRGDAVNTGGPVGRKDGYAGRRPGGQNSSQIGDNQTGGGSGAGAFLRSTGGKSSIGTIILLIIVGIVLWRLGVFNACSQGIFSANQQSLMDGTFSNGGTVSSTTWTGGDNREQLNTKVDSSARDKFTTIKGNGQDKVTVMVYMCGTDLESKYGMATNDLREMAAAGANNPNFNIIVFTGGCNQWKTSAISNRYNQVYKVTNNGIARLVENAGSAAMTDPNTLVSFIQFCTENFKANRYELILWDHGGGSVSGYGYDEKNAKSGSMSLDGINTALKKANVKFDFIGFDACLMATLENAIMLEPYADYMIASEETEPGVGWYYTNWVKAFAGNTSMETLDVAKMIIDDFVEECNKSCQGQKTTLSVVDLGELAATVKPKFNAFSVSTANLVKSDYQKVSDARNNSREFATTSHIDQIDLVHLAYNLDTAESKALAEAIRNAVKYNRTSSNMTNCYGLSIFFPYRKSSKVDAAVNTYNKIGVDSAYSRCIQQFASMGVAGQAAGYQATTGSSNISSASPLTALTGQQGGSLLSSGDMSSLLGSLMGSGGGDMLGSLLGGGGGFFGRSIGEIDGAAEYIVAHQFDPSKLKWTESGDKKVIDLPGEQWDMVHSLLLNVFVDDGSGYIDLGLDNVFEFTERGELIGEYDQCWLGIDGQVVAYYFMDEVKDDNTDIITGRVPCLITHSQVSCEGVELFDENGNPIEAGDVAEGEPVTVRANLILVCTNGDWKIAGVLYDYVDGESDTIAKCVNEITVGATIEPLCDYYSYSGDYQNSYRLGEPFTYTGKNVVGDYQFSMNFRATYMFTDIYGMEYWTEAIGNK